MTRNPADCLGSWAEELISRASRVRNLIGSAHWLSDGHHKEELVREFLARHLPSSLRVSRGFICSADPETRVSPEIDILITSQNAELPWFCEGGIVIAPPNAVCGQLHVKTEFGMKEIGDVLDGVFNAYVSCEPQLDPSQIWSGAIFFTNAACDTPDATAARLTSALDKYLEEHTDVRRTKYLPDCIAVLEGPIFTVERCRNPKSEGLPIAIRGFECAKLSIAILLSHFYDSIATDHRNARKRGAWTQLLQRENYRKILEHAFTTQ